jgi:hypothetical protein
MPSTLPPFVDSHEALEFLGITEARFPRLVRAGRIDISSRAPDRKDTLLFSRNGLLTLKKQIAEQRD